MRSRRKGVSEVEDMVTCVPSSPADAVPKASSGSAVTILVRKKVMKKHEKVHEKGMNRQKMSQKRHKTNKKEHKKIQKSIKIHVRSSWRRM